MSLVPRSTSDSNVSDIPGPVGNFPVLYSSRQALTLPPQVSQVVSDQLAMTMTTMDLFRHELATVKSNVTYFQPLPSRVDWLAECVTIYDKNWLMVRKELDEIKENHSQEFSGGAAPFLMRAWTSSTAN